MPRCGRFALILVAALTALGISSAFDLDAANDLSVGREAAGDASFAFRTARAEGPLARWTGDAGRDSASSKRSLKQRLVLFVVVATLLVAARFGGRGALVDVAVRRPTATRWSPRGARSPPATSASIA